VCPPGVGDIRERPDRNARILLMVKPFFLSGRRFREDTDVVAERVPDSSGGVRSVSHSDQAAAERRAEMPREPMEHLEATR
jgi:hypothetical protein